MELLKMRFVLRLLRWKSRELWHRFLCPFTALCRGQRQAELWQSCDTAAPLARSGLTHPKVSSLGKEPNWPLDCSIHSLGHRSWEVSPGQGQRGAPRALQCTHAGNTFLPTRACARYVHTSAQLLKSRIKWCTTEQAHESLQNLNIYFQTILNPPKHWNKLHL